MSEDLAPDHVLDQLKKGKLSPFYLFYGPDEFRLERVLSRIRETSMLDTVRDLNLQIYHGDKAAPADIVDSARSLPFMSERRLIIVRRTEAFSAAALESFISYLERPVDSTCLIFVSSRPNLKMRFFRTIRDLGQAVHFRNLTEGQVISWIKKLAKELGLNMEDLACTYLQQIVGNQMMDLHAELQKLHLRYGNTRVGVEEVRTLAIYGRIYTIFELIDEIAFKRLAQSLSMLDRFLEEEGDDSALRVVGMLNRQIRLLWQTKSLSEAGGRLADVNRKLGLPNFLTSKILEQSRGWKTGEFERAFHLLYQADGLLKSGARARLVLENLVLSLCV